MPGAAQQLDRPAAPSAGARSSRRRPPLRLAPPPRRRAAARHDGLYVMTLAALLAVGILGVLLLNTAMQTQADRIASAQHRLAGLTLDIQTLRVDLDREQVPAALAARAQALHLQPATRLPVLVLPRDPRVALPVPPAPHAKPGGLRAERVSARARAASRVRAG